MRGAVLGMGWTGFVTMAVLATVSVIHVVGHISDGEWREAGQWTLMGAMAAAIAGTLLLDVVGVEERGCLK